MNDQQEREALPPLPEPIIKESCPDGDYEGYTADQMHAYARAALATKTNPAPGYCPHCKQYSIEEPLYRKAKR